MQKLKFPIYALAISLLIISTSFASSISDVESAHIASLYVSANAYINHRVDITVLVDNKPLKNAKIEITTSSLQNKFYAQTDKFGKTYYIPPVEGIYHYKVIGYEQKRVMRTTVRKEADKKSEPEQEQIRKIESNVSEIPLFLLPIILSIIVLAVAYICRINDISIFAHHDSSKTKKHHSKQKAILSPSRPRYLSKNLISYFTNIPLKFRKRKK